MQRVRVRSRRLVAVYDRYGDQVYGLAVRITGARAVAEELTAAVFADLVRRPAGGARTTVADRLLVDVHRRAVDWCRENRRYAAVSVPDGSPLEGLNGDVRRAVGLAYFGGRTYHDVAAELGISEAEAASLLDTGMRQMAAARRGTQAWSSPGRITPDPSRATTTTSSGSP